MKEIFSRFSKYMEVKGLTDYKVTKQSGISNGILGKARRGETDLGRATVEKLLETYSDLNRIWLLKGDGEMLIANARQEEHYAVVTNNTKAIPLVDIEAAAGYGTGKKDIEAKDIIAHYIIPDFSEAKMMLTVYGNSMYPLYQSGDRIAVRFIEEVRFIQWNKPYLIATRTDGLLIKRLKPTEKEDILIAMSDNPDYPPFKIPKDEIVGLATILGVVRIDAM